MSDKVVVGKIATAFGVKGWVKVISFTEPRENIYQYRQWTVFQDQRRGAQANASERRVLSVDDCRPHGDGLIVHFAGIDDRDEAKALAQYLIEIDADEMPLLDAGEYYWHQLEGLSVYQASASDKENGETSDSEGNGIEEAAAASAVNSDVVGRSVAGESAVLGQSLLGRVDHLLETGANDVLVVRPSEGSIDQRERLIPYLPGKVVLGVDLTLQRILVDWDATY